LLVQEAYLFVLRTAARQQPGKGGQILLSFIHSSSADTASRRRSEVKDFPSPPKRHTCAARRPRPKPWPSDPKGPTGRFMHSSSNRHANTSTRASIKKYGHYSQAMFRRPSLCNHTSPENQSSSSSSSSSSRMLVEEAYLDYKDCCV
jgi:hypothetical protein